MTASPPPPPTAPPDSPRRRDGGPGGAFSRLDGSHDDVGPHPSPSAGLAQVALIVLGEQPLGQVLEHVAEVTEATVPGAAGVSVTLVEGTRARSAGFSGPIAAALDERQYADGFGPCLDAARTSTIVHVHDTHDSAAYPDFAALAAREGVTSVVSIGMAMLGRNVGAMNVYCTSGALPASSIGLSRVFAAYASVALSNAVLFSRATDSVAQMREAMASRAVIEQAKGMLMGRHGITADEAFDQLSRRSQDENVKLREVAEDVVLAGSSGGEAGAAEEL